MGVSVNYKISDTVGDGHVKKWGVNSAKMIDLVGLKGFFASLVTTVWTGSYIVEYKPKTHSWIERSSSHSKVVETLDLLRKAAVVDTDQRIVVRVGMRWITEVIVNGKHDECSDGEPVAYDVPAVAARRRTGSVTGRNWA